MKFTLRLTLILGFLTLCAGFPAVVRASDSSRSQKDSLRQVVSRTDGPDKIGAYKELARLYRMESRKEGVLDTLLTIYDALAAEAQQTGDVAEQSAAGYNRLIALYDNWLFDEIIRQALAILAFQSENGLWKNYYQTYTMLLDAYRRKRDFDRALEEANRVYDDAKGRGDRAGMGVALHAVARIYTDQRRFPEAEKSLRESIEMMQDETAYLNTLASVYNHLVQNLIAQERYDEALAAARETEAVNRPLRSGYEIPADFRVVQPLSDLCGHLPPDRRVRQGANLCGQDRLHYQRVGKDVQGAGSYPLREKALPGGGRDARQRDCGFAQNAGTESPEADGPDPTERLRKGRGAVQRGRRGAAGSATIRSTTPNWTKSGRSTRWTSISPRRSATATTSSLRWAAACCWEYCWA